MSTDLLARITEQVTRSEPLEIITQVTIEETPRTVIYLVGCNTVAYKRFFLIVIGESNLLALGTNVIIKNIKNATEHESAKISETVFPIVSVAANNVQARSK